MHLSATDPYLLRRQQTHEILPVRGALFGPLYEAIGQKQLRCDVPNNPLLPIRRSARRLVLGAIKMSQRSQIERLKFGGLRSKRLMGRVPVTCSDHREY